LPHHRAVRRAFFVACFASLLLAPAADAATWNSLQLPGEASSATLFGISCPETSLCAAVGANNTIASSSDPGGGQASWKVTFAGTGSEPQASNYRQIRGISCPSARLCVAVTFEGLIYTSTDPASGGWTVTDLDPGGSRTHLYGISCPTVEFCVASAADATIVTSINPTGGAAAWQKTQLEGPLELRGISCPSVALCVVVGDDGDNIRPGPEDHGVILASADPLSGIWQRAQAPLQGNAYGVSCPARNLCVSGDLRGNLLVSTDPSSPTSWRSFNGGASVQITDVDCPTASLCAAVDNNGDVLTSTDPAGGAGSWTLDHLAAFPAMEETPANGFFGVSCPGTGLCAISAASGQIFTSTDPFSTDGPSPSAQAPQKKSGGRRFRPRRPRVKLASGPWPEVQLDHGALPVTFRFYALHHPQFRGFVCRIDGRPLQRCSSPRHYRVGVGRHIFRVRAIGWSGLRGPAASDLFWVCHPRPTPGCGRSKTVTAPPPAKERPPLTSQRQSPHPEP
jgi:hypothetical protein